VYSPYLLSSASSRDIYIWHNIFKINGFSLEQNPQKRRLPAFRTATWTEQLNPFRNTSPCDAED